MASILVSADLAACFLVTVVLDGARAVGGFSVKQATQYCALRDEVTGKVTYFGSFRGRLQEIAVGDLPPDVRWK